ncbi:MAG: hypothetical protein Q4C42_03620, partial [Clostridia bacterium]|nr:hypothetical protein [Clostridia bacterium]
MMKKLKKAASGLLAVLMLASVVQQPMALIASAEEVNISPGEQEYIYDFSDSDLIIESDGVILEESEGDTAPVDEVNQEIESGEETESDDNTEVEVIEEITPEPSTEPDEVTEPEESEELPSASENEEVSDEPSAEEPSESEESSVPEENSEEPGVEEETSEDSDSDAEVSETEEEIISEEETVSEEAKDTEEKVPFDSTLNLEDKILVNVSAAEGVFPKGAQLHVELISNEDKINTVENCVKAKREADKNVLSRYILNIYVTDENGNEVQPDTAFGEAVVHFGLFDNKTALAANITDELKNEIINNLAADVE